MEALAPLIGALLTVAACYALGSLLLARLRVTLARAEKPPLAFTLGAAVLHLAIFAILTLHIAYTPVLVALLGTILAAALWSGEWRLPQRLEECRADSRFTRAVRWLFLAAAGAFTYVYFFNAWAPEISPDGSSYHLPLIARYLRVHGFEAIPTSLFASLSQGVELVFLPAFAIAGSLSGASLSGGGSGAALVHLAFLMALALTVRAYGQRTGHGLAGDAAALLVYFSPVAGIVGTAAYIDLAAAAIVFAAFYWTQIWDDDRGNSLLICIGLLGGYCYAAKYTAAVMAIYGVGFVLWRSRSFRAAALVAACAAMMAAPWLVKNWIYVGNPIAPFANRIFRNPYIHPDFERRLIAFLQDYGLSDLRKLPWDAIVEGRATQTPLGPVFLLLPVGLLALRKKTGRRVLLPAALLFSTYFTNVGTRFLLPCLPFGSLALAMACEELPLVLLVIVLFHATASWPRNLRWYAKDAWALYHTPVRAALRRQSEDSYLSGFPNYRAARFIERTVPLGEKVFALSGVAESYTSREILVDYASAFNEQLSDILSAAWDEIAKPSRALVFHFSEHALRRIRVVQTTAAPKADEEWSVHEFRIYCGGREVPRSGEWKLRAFPNPWGVPYAFDNSEVTRWRSWETAAPGMYIDVDFHTEIRADQVRIETSTDNPDLRLRLEEMDGAGRWIVIDQKPEEFTLTSEVSLWRSAAYELRSLGVRYLFIRDADPGAQYYAQDPASWDFTPVARAEGATIYKIGR